MSIDLSVGFSAGIVAGTSNKAHSVMYEAKLNHLLLQFLHQVFLQSKAELPSNSLRTRQRTNALSQMRFCESCLANIYLKLVSELRPRR